MQVGSLRRGRGFMEAALHGGWREMVTWDALWPLKGHWSSCCPSHTCMLLRPGRQLTPEAGVILPLH